MSELHDRLCRIYDDLSSSREIMRARMRPDTTKEDRSIFEAIAAACRFLSDCQPFLSAPVAQAAEVWQLMDAAPKDGTEVLLYTAWEGEADYPAEPFSCVQIGYWDDGNLDIQSEFQRSAKWETQKIGTPTHWMPLPAAPTPKAEGEQP